MFGNLCIICQNIQIITIILFRQHRKQINISSTIVNLGIYSFAQLNTTYPFGTTYLFLSLVIRTAIFGLAYFVPLNNKNNVQCIHKVLFVFGW